MRLDYEYLKTVLDVFLDSSTPTVNWESFQGFHGTIENEHKFVFHIEILADKDLVRGAGSDGSFGIQEFQEGQTEYYYVDVPWRLTAAGHDFAAALNKPTVMAIIKEKFQKEGLSAVIDITKSLVISQAEKRLAEIVS
jgi:hypothetical protein